MRKPHKFFSHAERAQRRARVKADLRAGVPVSVIAERHGLSIPHVRDIARRAQLARRPGRPPMVSCPDLRVEYYNLRRDLGAPVARQIMGLPL